MALKKVVYVHNQTPISAENLNEIQDSIINLEKTSGPTNFDQEAIVQQVIAALGTPVFGTVDLENNIILSGELVNGTYTVKYEDGEGNLTNIGDIIIGASAPTYKNWIPLSTDDSGAIYNGVGYKAGFRWSTSSKAEKAQEGAYLSGWIPVKSGDVVRLKNVSINKSESAVSNQNNVAMASPDKNTQWNFYTTTLEQMKNPVFDSNGYLTQFTIEPGTSFIRFTAQYIGEDSVVTINEEIV